MRSSSAFTASAAPTVANPLGGGSVAVPNPAAAGGASALMLAGTGGITLVRFAATGSFAPAVLNPDLADVVINAGGLVLITAPGQVEAPFLIVAGGGLSATPGSVGTSINLNS